MVASLVSDLGQLSKSRDFEEATSKSSPAGIFSRLPILAAMRQRFLALQNSAEIASRSEKCQFCFVRWLMRFRRLARRDEYAGQHQRKADEVEQLRALAEKDDRHRRSEHRHDMKEWRGAVGADQLHAAIEAQIGERRWKHRDVEQRQQVRRIELHHRAREQFPDPKRDQAHGTAAEGEGDKR